MGRTAPPRASCGVRGLSPVWRWAARRICSWASPRGASRSPGLDAASARRTRRRWRRGLAHCAAHGITSMVNMDGNRYTLRAAGEMEAEGRLLARVKVPFHFKPHMELSELDRASAMAAEFAGDWVTSGFVKMFMDGVVDSRTAYMLNDYPGVPGTGRAAVRAGAVQGHLHRDRPARVADRGPCHRRRGGAQTIDGYEAARPPMARATAATGSSISS
jgi:predicted amidohydrolase YtcJ